ncbi:MAG TPA: hypothetical protein VMR16_00780 [Candidatus Saccharimonadales bacterium]|nr:hypothetical protein [Candidatus Saccharimonadales bacterium]
MKDFDYDEIDRAVGSVNNPDPDANDHSADPTTSLDQPTSNEPAKPAVQTPPTPSTPPALAGRRSSGQFMDVVHPSSNMRRAPFKMPERSLNQTPTSTPLPLPDKPPVVPTPTPPTPDDIKPNPQPEPEPEKTELPTPTIPNDGWSDSKNENEDADIDQISDDITTELSNKTDELPDTPFISGTKVEKRPLGAFSTDSTPSDPVSTPDAPVEPEEKKDESLPDELQDKLLSIESNESTPGPEPTQDIIDTVEKPVVVEKTDTPAVENQPAAAATAATSITQQYKEKPSTGDRDSGPIYDTDAYHKPLVPPAKKKSSWIWVIWILVIIIVGVGVGILVNNYVLPNL